MNLSRQGEVHSKFDQPSDRPVKFPDRPFPKIDRPIKFPDRSLPKIDRPIKHNYQ